jgi:hypothetical protein
MYHGIFPQPAFICKPHGARLHGTFVHILCANDTYSSSHITIIACSSTVQFKMYSIYVTLWDKVVYKFLPHKQTNDNDNNITKTFTKQMHCQMRVGQKGLGLRLGLLCLTPLSKYFSYIVAVSFIGGENRKIRRKPPTYRKSLTNFIIIMLYRVHLTMSGIMTTTALVGQRRFGYNNSS